MPLTRLELVMLDSGEIALRRSDDEAALVEIKFAQELLDFIVEDQLDIAKVMIDAGIARVTELQNESAPTADELFEKPNTLH